VPRLSEKGYANARDVESEMDAANPVPDSVNDLPFIHINASHQRDKNNQDLINTTLYPIVPGVRVVDFDRRLQLCDHFSFPTISTNLKEPHVCLQHGRTGPAVSL
jgi:hypothetical protein